MFFSKFDIIFMYVKFVEAARDVMLLATQRTLAIFFYYYYYLKKSFHVNKRLRRTYAFIALIRISNVSSKVKIIS